MSTVGWVDGAAGASGDMLLGALVDAGVPLPVLQDAVDALGVEQISLVAGVVERGGLGATKVDVRVPPAGAPLPTRTWADVRLLLERAPLAPQVRGTAQAVFAALARAEGEVHRLDPDSVHFHEVGALDALADVVATAAGLDHLALDALHCSPLSLGSGRTRGAHGPLPVPAPAVLALLAGCPVRAGPAPYEMTTPTGAALLVTTVTAWGALPAMRVTRVGTGAGGRDPAEVANVLRLVLGESDEALRPEGAGAGPATEAAIVLEANVDDQDPRLWPGVLAALLAAGASDAWLTPVLMKKGRPAHTLSVLCPPGRAAALARIVLTDTSTLGLRQHTVGKRALARSEDTVTVEGQPVRVKSGWLDGVRVNRNPEWADVAAAAAALGRPAKQVLDRARAAALELPGTAGGSPLHDAGPPP